MTLNTRRIQGLTAYGLGVAATAGQCAVAYAEAQPIIAEFAAGDSNQQVDACPGLPGDGWASPWDTTTANAARAEMLALNADPLTPDGGAYLKLRIRAAGQGGSSQAVVQRRFDTSAIDPAQPAEYRFRVRLDNRFGPRAHQDDTESRVFIFNDTGGRPSPGTGGNNTWGLQTGFDGIQRRLVWFYQDGPRADALTSTSLPAEPGRVYHFTVRTNPANHTYHLTVEDDAGGNYDTTGGPPAAMRSQQKTDGNRLHFGAVVDRDQPQGAIGLSIDDIHLTQRAGEPQ